MTGGMKPQGYTIVEVLIFLAVTAGLFALVATTFAGRRAGTEFSVAVREMESRLQDTINDISTGYYSNPGTFSCEVNVSNVPQPAVGGTAQGKNDECIFIGRVVQFDLAGSGGKQYNTYTVTGARQVTVGTTTKEVEGFDDANPRAIVNPPWPVDITEVQTIPPGLVVQSMHYVDGLGSHAIRAVGFFSSFGSYGSEGLSPGSLSVDVLPLAAGGNTKADVAGPTGAIASISDTSIKNPPGGVVICLRGDATNQYAELKLGGSNRQLTTDLTIRSTSC